MSDYTPEELAEIQADHDDLCCEICGAMMESVSCWHCDGEGGFHDCGEDCCCCLDKEVITEWCEECHGEGEYLECMALPHTDEQMAEHAKRERDNDRE